MTITAPKLGADGTAIDDACLAWHHGALLRSRAHERQAAPALYLGTTSGELWIGRDEGARWSNIARHLPEIYAVEVAEVA